jgi:hypothetical protein
MDQPTPALTEPTDTGSDDAQQTGQADATAAIYSPFKADRGPSADEIETWRRSTYDDLITRAGAQGAPTEHGSLAEHGAATMSGRVYMDWTRIMERAAAEGLDDDTAVLMCRQALTAAMTGQHFDAEAAPGQGLPSAPVGRAPAPVSDVTADGQPFDTAPATATDEDGEAVDADVLELAQRYEELRLAARDAGASREVFAKEKLRVEREFLRAMVDSGHAHISLVLPSSGENRVLTPVAKVWPKVREDEEAPADENGKRPLIDVERRMQALRDAGLGHLIVEKIDDKALRETFEGYATEEDMPDALREIYSITRQWSVSSNKGRSGRVSGPTTAEVEQGKAPRATR